MFVYVCMYACVTVVCNIFGCSVLNDATWSSALYSVILWKCYVFCHSCCVIFTMYVANCVMSGIVFALFCLVLHCTFVLFTCPRVTVRRKHVRSRNTNNFYKD